MQEQLQKDLVESIKSKDTLTSTLLRAIKTAITVSEKLGNDVGDKEVVAIIRKQINQRKDSYEQFTKAGRNDLANKEQLEIEILEGYLPEQLTSDEVVKIITKVIEDEGASSRKDMGKVMKACNEIIAGKFDGKELSQMVMVKL